MCQTTQRGGGRKTTSQEDDPSSPIVGSNKNLARNGEKKKSFPNHPNGTKIFFGIVDKNMLFFGNFSGWIASIFPINPI